MAKQLNVNLAFTADTKAAESNIKQLQQSLNQIATTTAPGGMKLNADMQTAVASAKELQMHLNNAFDVKTGNFNLNALNNSLKTSGKSLSDLTSGLLKAGLQGEQAFMNVQRAITSSNVQINKANGALSQFLVTLRNTARWQLSSMLLHGFMNGLQSSIQYAQDLDESLNNIRIVTGYSADQMAIFAEKANKAAKALSTTTTEYTNASLIYYQQGLSDEEVQKRTDITIKMANVARESAEVVSDQMTAVWNNFYDGSKSLEYYADVMTALGAATASSTDEIAEGLEKFAAIADSVGLSYEYATSALATVTATTRQSADVVGTAFKTLFARIQDLELGETLDDGVTLGKYSEALNTVGVNILDANKNLRDMDDILNDLGARWDNLAQAEKVSVAQTVAGVRQYTQLIALMDNWDYFQENLGTAKGATGALNEQAEIYAESWEAANDRVKAAAEGLYNSLIPTDFIVSITNAFADIIDVVDVFIDGMGGLQTILLVISTIMLNKMQPAFANTINNGVEGFNRLKESISESINRISNTTGVFKKLQLILGGTKVSANELKNNLSQISGDSLNTAAKQTQFFKDNLKDSANQMVRLSQESIKTASKQTILTDSFKSYMTDMAQVNNLQTLINQGSARLTSSEKANLSILQEQLIAIADKKQKEQETLEIINQQKNALIENVDASLFDSAGFRGEENGQVSFESTLPATQKLKELVQEISNEWINIIREKSDATVILDDQSSKVKTILNDENELYQLHAMSKEQLAAVVELNLKIAEILDAENTETEEKKKKINELLQSETERGNISAKILNSYKQAATTMTNFKNTMKQGTVEAKAQATAMGVSSKTIKDIEVSATSSYMAQKRITEASIEHKNVLSQISTYFTQAISKAGSLGGVISKAASGFSTIAMGISAVQSAIDTIGDDEASFGSKLSAGAMAAVMGISALKAAIGGITTVMTAYQGYQAIATTQTQLQALAVADLTQEELKEQIVEKTGIASEVAATLAETLHTQASKAQTAQTKKETAAIIAEAAANHGLAISEYAALAPMLLTIAALAALGAAIFGIVKLYDALTLSAEEAAEQAAASAKALGEESAAAAQKVEDIKSAFDEYFDIVDTLDTLTKGTEEFDEALKQVNQSVLDILEKYPDLAKMEGVLVGDPGNYRLNEDVLDVYLAQAERQALQIKGASLMAQAESRAAKNNLKKDDLVNQIVFDAGSDYSKIGSAVAQIVNQTVDLTDKSEDFKKAIDVVYHASETETEDFKEAVRKVGSELGVTGGYLDLFVNGVSKNQKALGEYADEAEASALQMKNVAKVLAGIDLGEKATKEQSEQYQNAYNKAYEEITKGTGNDAFAKNITDNLNWMQGYNSEEVQKVWEKYAAMTGETRSLNTKNTVQGWDNNRSFSLINEDGETVTITADEMIKKYAAAYAQQQAEAAVRGGLEGIDAKLAEQGIKLDPEVSTNIANTLLGNVQNYTKETLEILNKELEGKTAIEQEKIISKFLNTKAMDEEAEAQKLIKDASEKYELNADTLTAQSKILANAYGLTAKQGAKLAIENQRMNKGVEKLSENWKDWNKILKKADLDDNVKLTQEYAETIGELNNVVEDLVGATVDLNLDDAFYSKNIGLIEEAAKGSTKAINELGIAVAEATINDLNLMGDAKSIALITSEFSKAVYDTGSLDNLKSDVIAGLAELQQKVADGAIKVGDGAFAMEERWIQSLNTMAELTGMSVEEMNSLLSTMGVDAEVVVKNIPIETTKVGTIHYMDNIVRDDVTNDILSYEMKTKRGEEYTTTDNLQVAQISTEDDPNKDFKVTYVGNGKVSETSVKTGSDNKPSKKTVSKKSDVVERYKEQDDALDNIEETLKDINREMDKAYGSKRIAAINKYVKELSKENEKLREKIKLAKETYLPADQFDLNKAAGDLGISFSFDTETGDITNYTSAMTEVYNKLRAAQEHFNTLDKESQEAYEESVLGPLEEKIDILEAAIALYTGTLEQIEEFNNQIKDNIDEQLSKNYEKIEHEIEVKLDINEADMELLEYYFNKFSDDIYSLVEALAVIKKLDFDSDGETEGYVDEYFGLISNNQAIYGSKTEAGSEFAKMQGLYKLGLTGSEDGISEADYVKWLQEARDATMSNIQALDEWDKTMLSFYSDTLAATNAEIEKQIGLIEQSNSRLEHYQDTITMINGYSDPKMISQIHDAQAEAALIEAKAAKSQYDFNVESRDNLKDKITNAKKYGYTEAEVEEFKEQLKVAEEKVIESQNNMAAKTTAWLEAEKQKVKDAIDSSHRTLEKALTGSYGTFDNLSKHMEASSLLQDEFLTKTNLLYETNTMLRKMEEDVDKAQTATAKQKIKEASEEIKTLQEKEDVTKTELELAQAKYDVTLAQIALEEAQNAKSKVRLQRDSEGNFGYVYTADAEKVSKAEQDLADAENKLYNKALDAANEYGEKMLQTQAEMAEEYKKLEEDRWNGAFASEEEFQAAKDALEAKYNAKFKAYSASYTAALNADSTAQKDTWTSNYTEMINKTLDSKTEQGKWLTVVTNSYTDVSTANTNYKDTVAANKALICEALGLEKEALDDNTISTDELKKATDKVTEASEDFADELDTNLIDDMKKALREAEKLTAEYIDQKEAIDGAKKSWMEYLLALGTEIKSVAKAEPEDPPPNDEDDGDKKDDESPEPDKPTEPEPPKEPTLSAGSTVTVKPSATHFSRETGYGTTMRSYVPGNNFKVWKIDGDEVLIGDPSGPNYTASGVTGWVKKTDLVGFLTGGYTGAWGPAGKLAMLHEKELVLNQNDTANFLSAIGMLRDIAHMIDLQAIHSQFTSMMMPMFSSAGMGDILEQQVQIEAHFPNVTSHSEIEEAFKNLINVSSQYANRKL